MALEYLDDGEEQYGPQDIYRSVRELEQQREAFAARQAEDRRQRFERAAAELEQRKYGPSRAEQLLALSAAFAAPRRYKGFGATLENILPVLGQTAAARRQGDQTRADAMLELEQRYAQAGMDSEANALKGREGMLRTLAALAKEKKRRTGFDPVSGDLKDMDTGELISPSGTRTSGLPRPASEEEYNALPSGSQYIAPDGSLRTKPGGPTQSASGTFRNP